MGVFERRYRHALDQAGAAVRHGRMGVDHRLAAVELLEHRQEGRIAEILVAVAGPQRDPLRLEHVQAIFDLAQAAFGVGQRNDRERAEAALVVALQIGRVFVAGARQAAGLLVLLAEPHARIEDRDHRGVDAGLVHVVERHGDRPFGRRALVGDQGLGLDRRDDVVVDVDPARLGRRLRRGGRLREAGGAPTWRRSPVRSRRRCRTGSSAGSRRPRPAMAPRMPEPDRNKHIARRNHAVRPACS